MTWLYVIVAIVGIAAFVFVGLPLLAKKAPSIVEVPQLIPMPQMPQLPTEIKIDLSKIDFPEIPEIDLSKIDFPEIPEIPELPDFEKIIKLVMDGLPSTEDVKKDLIDPVVDELPSWEDVKKDLIDPVLDKLPSTEDIPLWFKDPIGYVREKIVTAPLRDLGEAIDKNITQPLKNIKVPVVATTPVARTLELEY